MEASLETNPDIKHIDFADKPSVIDPWTWGDSITRSNFLSFLSTSFSASRGYRVAQIQFIDYMAKLNKLDPKILLQDFTQSGGYDALSVDEQQQFLDRMEKVGIHHHTPLGPEGSGLLENIKDDLDRLPEDFETMPKPEGLTMNKQEFRTYLNNEIQKHYSSSDYKNSDAYKAREAYKQRESPNITSES